MWVILPNGDDGSDVERWGLTGTALGLARQDGACERVDEPRTAVLSAAAMVVINTQRAWEPDSCADYADLLRSIQPAECKVWIHFGNENSNALTRSRIRTLWEKAVGRGPAFQSLRDCAVSPFSMTTRMQWDVHLQQLAAAFMTALDPPNAATPQLQEAIAKLDEAWSAALGYYDATKPLREWLGAIFPLHLDLMGLRDAATAPGAAAWWEAALHEYHATRGAMRWNEVALVGKRGEQGVLDQAEKELPKMPGDASYAALRDRVFKDCRAAAALLTRLDEAPGAPPSRDEAATLLSFSELLRMLEQQFAT